MSYKIQYGTSKFDPVSKPKVNLRVCAALGMIVGILLFTVLCPQETSILRRRIFPMFEPKVQEAFGEMAEQISKGTSVSDAAEAFCREILIESEN